MQASRFAVCAAVMLAAAVTGCGNSTPEGSSFPSAAGRAPAPSSQPAPPLGPPPSELATRLPADAIRASLPELPIAPAPRPRNDVVAAYEFAALHPEVLKYVPCYCGCERSGHVHNESCFVASRDPEGRVVSWDTHGMG